MDVLTHSLIALHLARLPSAIGIPAAVRLLVCLAASNAPDLDRLLLLPLRAQLLPLGPAGAFHSLPGAALLTIALGFVARPLAPPEHRRILFLLVGSSVGLHLATDALTASGLPLFWPLASRRHGLAWLSSPDPWLWFLLAAPLLRSSLRERSAPQKLRLSATRSGVVALVSLYLGISAVTKVRAIQATWRALPTEPQVEEVQAYPLGPGPLRWTTLARTSDGRWQKSRVVLTEGLFRQGSVPSGASDPRMRIALETAEGRAFLAEAKAPFLVHATEVGADGSFEVALGDLRFSDPASDRLPWVLWLRIGPSFATEAWTGVSSPH